MLAFRIQAVGQGARKILEGPVPNAVLGVRRDVGNKVGARARFNRQPSGEQRLPLVGCPVTGDAAGDPCDVEAAI